MATPYKIFVTRSGTDSAAPVTNGVAVTGTNVYYSEMWTGEDTTAYSLELFWDGTMTGTPILQVSNHLLPDETTDADWVTSTEVALTSPAGSDVHEVLTETESPTYRKRIKYTNASGSGVVYGWVTVPRWNNL